MRRVLFLTVMPSPYQRQLFQALHLDGRLDVRVLYCTHSAADRHWSIGSLAAYEEVLPGTTIKWLGPSAHLNRSVTKRLKEDLFDLFVVADYSSLTSQLAMRHLTRRDKRWVFWGEVPGFSQRGPLGRLLRQRLQRPIAKGATAVAAIGSGAVDAYQALFPHLRVFNIPYYCDLAQFRIAAKNRFKQTKQTVDVLFSGQLIERKGVDLLIQAFVKISDQVPELRLLLLGTGPDLDVLTTMIPLGLRERIHFLGFQQPTDMAEIFAAADVFVLPSRHDGWGVVVNEALGAGLPIIVSDRVGARDLVKNGCNGFITPAGDVDSLAKALLKLGQCSDLRKSFSCASAERAAHWGVDEGVRRWVELSDYLLDA